VHATINDCTFSYTGGSLSPSLTLGRHAYGSITNSTLSSTSNDALLVATADTLAANIVTNCTNCTLSTTGAGGLAAVHIEGIGRVRLDTCTLSSARGDGYGLLINAGEITMNGGSISNAAFGVYADNGATVTEGTHVTMTNVGTHKSANRAATINGF
jgi:hypothetical protein